MRLAVPARLTWGIVALLPLGAGADHADPVLVARLADAAVVESSGLAASGVDPGLLWTINDSGNAPLLYATNRDGRALGRVLVDGATNIDWEDLAAGPGTDGGPALYIADIGDAARVREDVTIYRLPEPSIDPSAPPTPETPIESAPAERFPLLYPDGPHDAETLLVDPRTGDVMIVTKERFGPARLYRLPQPMVAAEPRMLEFLGVLKLPDLLAMIGLVTGGSVSAAGDRVVVRGYGVAFEWSIGVEQTLAEALAGAPRRLPLPGTGQGEAVAYQADAQALLLTAEGSPCPLYELMLTE